MTGVQTCALPICFPVTIRCLVMVYLTNFYFDYDRKVVLNYKFFKVNPSVLDPIFGVAADSTWDTDQLLVNSYIGCYVARNLSRDGVPY